MSHARQNILIEKLDAFIRKYYKNQLIRGLIYFTGLMLVVVLAVILLAHFGQYGSPVRAFLFYATLCSAIYLFIKYLIYPVSGLLRLGKTMSYDEASKIVGSHFPDISDRLLNTLQLMRADANDSDRSMLEAAILQRTEQLKPIPFVAAIDLKANRKQMVWIAIPVLVYLVIYLIAPGMISDGTLRVIRYNKTFVNPPPFKVNILNDKLQTEQFTDFELEAEFSGREIPNEANVVIDGHSYRMENRGEGKFTYLFSSVRESTLFAIDAASYLSEAYTLKVLSRPRIERFSVYADYPAYTGKVDEEIGNPGDLNVPAGTQLKWKFNTRKTDEIKIAFNGILSEANRETGDLFTFSKKVFLSTPYSIQTIQKEGGLKDSMHFYLQVVSDAYPMVTLDEKADSINTTHRFFIADFTDDYGLSKLTFNLQFLKSEDKEKLNQPVRVYQLAVPHGEKSHRLYHQFFMEEAGVKASDEVAYYFEIWDNDGVHGPKSVKSKTMVYRAPSLNELEKENETGKGELKDKMEEAIKEARSLQKELKAAEQKMLEKRELTWEEKKKLEQLSERQKTLSEQIEKIKQEQKSLSEKEKEFNTPNEELLRKQQQIDKMFNEIMNNEMKELIRKLEQMMQLQNKDQIKQEMDKLQLNNKDIEKELDRMLEHFKQLELEKKMEDAANKLDKLADKQKELGEKTDHLAKEKLNKEEKQEKLSEVKKEQQKLNDEFKQAQEKLKEIEKSNKALEQPKQLEDTKEEQKQIEDKQEQSKEKLEKEKPEEAAKDQKEAAEKMKKLSSKMKDQMEEEEEKEDEINAESLREILENTIQLSNDQEKLMEEFKQVSNYNPQYVAMAKIQKNIRENAKMIEDSLLALSKKVPEISSFVNKEVTRLNENLINSVEGYSVRNIPLIRQSQQQAMMNANNLALMLSDILKQMQEKMNGNSKGKSGKMPKKGQGQGKGKGSGKSMSSLKKMQEELNRQLREGLNKQEGKGDKPGEKPGQNPGGTGSGSQEFARMAAQQMAIRQQMQKMLSEMGTKEKEGLGGQGKLQELQRLMEQTEKELFNKRLSNEMINRQEDIMTRMLESEKAEKKQEQDNKRESEQAKEKPKAQPPSFEQYLKQKKSEQEMLQSIPAEMQPYYKEKAKVYFNKK